MESVDLLYKLWPLIAFIGIQFTAFIVLQVDHRNLKRDYEQNKKLQWEKLDELKGEIQKSNLTLMRIATLLELKNQHDKEINV